MLSFLFTRGFKASEISIPGVALWEGQGVAWEHPHSDDVLVDDLPVYDHVELVRPHAAELEADDQQVVRALGEDKVVLLNLAIICLVAPQQLRRELSILAAAKYPTKSSLYGLILAF